MTLGDEYRVKAAYMRAAAKQEKNQDMRTEFENLARVYRRLAKQADQDGQDEQLYRSPPLQPNLEG